MSVRDPLADELTDVFPDGEFITTESLSVTETAHNDGTTSVKTTYPLSKAPYERLVAVRATVDGRRRSFVVGDDAEPADTDGDGEFNAVTLNQTPDPGTDLTVEYVTEALLARLLRVIDDDRRDVADRIDTVIDSKQLGNATGNALDRRGELFGSLGNRGSRTDSEYRSVLRSIVPAFAGRGTVAGLRFAVAIGAQTRVENITIEENFEQTGFEVNIDDPNTLVTAGLNDVIEQASPSGVELLSPPTIVSSGATASTSTTSSTVTRTRGIGSGTLGDGEL